MKTGDVKPLKETRVVGDLLKEWIFYFLNQIAWSCRPDDSYKKLVWFLCLLVLWSSPGVLGSREQAGPVIDILMRRRRGGGGPTTNNFTDNNHSSGIRLGHCSTVWSAGTEPGFK